MGRDTITGLAVIAASLVLFWATLGLERHPMVPIGPAFYPRIVLGITALMALALVAGDLMARRRAGTVAPAGARANYALVLACFAIFAVYVVAMPYLGFRLSTLLFLLGLPVAMERPTSRARWVAVVVTAVVATVSSYYMFEHYLHVLLPRGLWTDF
jgi:putative tricarboxylic transport membrane protein